jgi:hypothetical protein
MKLVSNFNPMVVWIAFLIMSSYYQSQKWPNFRNRQQDNNVGWMRLCFRNLGQQPLITKWVYSIV